MWHQVHIFGEIVRQFSQDSPDGIHLIGYSQGGLIARGIIETFSDLDIKTFVSLSSPQAGQYGGNLERISQNFFKNLKSKLLS